jgi:hypothetical protein
MKFRAVVEQGGKTARASPSPTRSWPRSAAGKKPAVSVTINGYTYRTSIATVSGTFKVGVSAEVARRPG